MYVATLLDCVHEEGALNQRIILFQFYTYTWMEFVLKLIDTRFFVCFLSRYVISYIPGGQTGLKFFSKLFYSVASKTVSKTLPVWRSLVVTALRTVGTSGWRNQGKSRGEYTHCRVPQANLLQIYVKLWKGGQSVTKTITELMQLKHLIFVGVMLVKRCSWTMNFRAGPNKFCYSAILENYIWE